MNLLVRFARFWWDFVVGDDARIAVGVVVMLALCAILTRSGVVAWWLPPVLVFGVLAISVRSASRPPQK